MRHAVILSVFVSTGCVTAFQPNSLDPGRGAAPMTPGHVNIHGGVTGAVTDLKAGIGGAGGAGFGIEGQVADDLAIGFSCADQVLNTPVGVAIPDGTYFTAQYNPSGFQNLAVRGSAGMGVDALPIAKVWPLAPWIGATLGIVTSATLGGLEPYLQVDLGARRYVGGPDSIVAAVPKIGGVGIIDNTISGAATAGFKLALGDSLSMYLSGTLGALVLTPDNVQTDISPTILQTSNGQIGISYNFDSQ